MYFDGISDRDLIGFFLQRFDRLSERGEKIGERAGMERDNKKR
jgi:hypothetical protein